MEAAWLNPRERCIPTDPVISSKELGLVEAFYGARPELKPTPLHRLRGIAKELSLGEVLLKDESSRFGLNAFKILGVLYAFHRIMESRVSNETPIVVCASAGNHGRAVAWAARES